MRIISLESRKHVLLAFPRGKRQQMRMPSRRKQPDPPHIHTLNANQQGFGINILLGIADWCREHRPWILLNNDRLLPNRETLASQRVDGAIGGFASNRLIELFRAHHIPLVNTSCQLRPDIRPPASVLTDNVAAGRMGAEYLLRRGFRRFVFFGAAYHNASVERLEGFQTALKDAGVGPAMLFDGRVQQTTPEGWAALRQKIPEWISGLIKPVGVMAFNDRLARFLIDACQSMGVQIPDDVSVIGVDNDPTECETALPRLTTVDPNGRRQGYEAAAMMARILDGETPAEPIRIPPLRIVERESTDLIATGDERIVMALRFVREHACENINVEDVVRHSGFSRRSLEQRFRRVLNRGIHEELLAARMDMCKKLLLESDWTIEEIAVRSGFKYAAQMHAVFREHMRMSPKTFRNFAPAAAKDHPWVPE